MFALLFLAFFLSLTLFLFLLSGFCSLLLCSFEIFFFKLTWLFCCCCIQMFLPRCYCLLGFLCASFCFFVFITFFSILCTLSFFVFFTSYDYTQVVLFFSLLVLLDAMWLIVFFALLFNIVHLFRHTGSSRFVGPQRFGGACRATCKYTAHKCTIVLASLSGETLWSITPFSLQGLPGLDGQAGPKGNMVRTMFCFLLGVFDLLFLVKFTQGLQWATCVKTIRVFTSSSYVIRGHSSCSYDRGV